MAKPLELEFVMSTIELDDLPDTPAEVAFAGRSNVGKSSLINALANRKKLAYVSNTPGRTQTLNLYRLAGAGTVMDLPGYGYAAAPKSLRSQWGEAIEAYLVGREQLRMVVVLVDGEIGPTKLDLQMLDWVRSLGLPHTVVATKHDKVRSSRRQKRKRELAEKCDLEPGDVVWTSAAKGVGIPRLRDLVLTWME